jgi:hypothetical protein
VVIEIERYLLTLAVAHILAFVRMRGLILFAAIAVSACGGASAAPGSSSGSSAPASRTAPGDTTPRGTVSIPCGPSGATTLAASGVARVYASGATVFGCSKHATGAISLGQTRSCIARPQVGPVVLKGELAAYGVRRCGVDTGRASVVVRRLDDRRLLHDSPAVTGRLRPESYMEVGSLVLAPDGSVAWIGTGTSVINPAAKTVEVHEIDRAGSRLLDSGGQIEPRSLRLRGSQLSWRHGTATRSARLV